MSNALEIPVGTLCEDLDYSSETTLPTLLDPMGPRSEDFFKKSYFAHRTLEIARLFSYEEFPMLDRLIAEFYVLNMESRREVFKFMEIKHEFNDDPEKVEKLKQIQ